MPTPDVRASRERPILRVVPPAPPEPPKRAVPWRSAALATLLVVGGFGLATLIVQRAAADALTAEHPAQALGWRPSDAEAMARLAERRLERRETAAAERLALAALKRDPTSGSAFRTLALATEDPARRDRLMTIAGDRMKRDIPAVSWLVADRLRKGRLAEAADRADGLMRAWPVSMRGTMEAQLRRLAAAPGGAELLAARLDADPPWRAAFLLNMARNGDNPGAAMAVYTAMAKGRKPPSEIETGSLVNRLVKDGQYPAAFLVWAQLLPPEGIANLADPYDGGFEGLPGPAPFNWQFFDRSGVIAEPTPNPDGQGQALYLRFTQAPAANVLARQLLALPPGRHTLTGRWKADGISVARPLVWGFRCAERNVAIVDPGTSLSGTTDWTTFSGTVDVPAGCQAQWLTLSSPGRARSDGEAWFDDLKITR
ncbi:MAG: hypothetical protein EON95_00475 [Caulobacteraceae bacterium]|nr:MAG: hypothetical protein EON95_00475 [Caulobacteraceae bacterium]